MAISIYQNLKPILLFWSFGVTACVSLPLLILSEWFVTFAAGCLCVLSIYQQAHCRDMLFFIFGAITILLFI
jgi:hypothetical protein